MTILHLVKKLLILGSEYKIKVIAPGVWGCSVDVESITIDDNEKTVTLNIKTMGT